MAIISARSSSSRTSANGGTLIFSARRRRRVAVSPQGPRFATPKAWARAMEASCSSFSLASFLLNETHIRHRSGLRNITDGSELRFIPADILGERLQDAFGVRRTDDHTR